MALSKVFFMNISLLITIAYLFNLGYKTAFQWLRPGIQEALASFIFIASGWLTMVFGLRVNDHILFDLRYVPLIMAVLILSKPWQIIAIGVGIGMGRLFFGINAASLAGMGNMFILGAAGALLAFFLGRSRWKFFRKAVVVILAINMLNCINISWLGVLPLSVYWSEYAPLTLLLSLLLSAFFVYMIRDFSLDQQRMVDLKNMNLILRRQTKEMREAKRDLEEKARQLLLSSRYKSEFLANMSHELKTPLNSMLLISQLIQESDDEAYGEEDKRYAGILKAAGVDLLHLIDDILDLSKVEAGKLQLTLENVPAIELLHSVQAQFQPVADRKGLPFRIEVEPDSPQLLLTDALRVNQVLRNLLTNAFKFTESGFVELKVSGERRALLPSLEENLLGTRASARLRSREKSRQPVPAPPDVDWIVFAVKDTGIGIDKEKQNLIFEAFQQEDGSITRQYGGTGLGLSISLQLSKLLGGMLELQSGKGEGSTFIFRMPADSSFAGPGEEGDMPQRI
ncbi:ATP-binding protein [Paenibacillus sp. D51F]